MQIPPGDLNVLCIGETLVDFISKEEVESLRDAYTFCKYLGGSPANIAVNVAKLGGQSAIISKTGSGAFGQFLKAELRRLGVNTDYMVLDHLAHTSFVFVSRTPGTPDFEASRNGDYKLSPQEVSEEAVARAQVIHASTWSLSRQPCRSAVKRAFELAQQHGKIISLDPNYSPRIWPDRREALKVLREMFAYVHLTKPSLDDAQRIFGLDGAPQDYIRRFHELGPQTVVFTMGVEGILLSQAGRLTHIPAQPVQVVDATGAGDAFWAGFLTALLDGNPLERCVRFARQVVGIKLTRVGPLPADLERADLYAHLEDG